MNVALASRGMKANDILDLAFDMGLDRPKMATAEDWGGGGVHVLTYGPLAYRKILEIPARPMRDHVERIFREALEIKPVLEQSHYNVVPPASAKPKAKRASKAAP